MRVMCVVARLGKNMNLYNHKNIHKKQSAFTILELLVVMGIMAVLITAGAVSYSTVQRVARDARRLQDLKDIQNGFEQYYSICNFRYGVTGAVVPIPLLAGTTLTCPIPNVNLITYPADPLGGNYQCVGSCTVSAYTVCPPDLGGGVYLETKNCTVASPNCCLRNQQ